MYLQNKTGRWRMGLESFGTTEKHLASDSTHSRSCELLEHILGKPRSMYFPAIATAPASQGEMHHGMPKSTQITCDAY